MLPITTKIWDEVRPLANARCHQLLNCSPLLAIACEVLARRITHLMPPERISTMMSTRYTFREADGDESSMSSALELAIDTGW